MSKVSDDGVAMGPGALSTGALDGVRLYDELAYLWPIISPPEDYAEEAAHWRRAIREKLGGGRLRVLELGVGGGHNLSHLTADFQATAVDISECMLEHSRHLNPGVEHHLGDMRTVRLNRKFDAVLAHDAISYMLTEGDLRAVFATARLHLRPGGLLLAAPDLVRDTFQDGKVMRWPARPPRRPGDPVVSVEERLRDPDSSDTVVESEFIYTITEGGVQRVERDVHVSGLFTIAAWTSLMEEAGFTVDTIPLPGDGDGCGEHLFRGVLETDHAIRI